MTDEMKIGKSTSGFCRDCLSVFNSRVSRCGSCGSPRLLFHPELFQLQIAHIDCDAFYASVEKRDNPELNDQPVIIGGGRRGVVSTCCYIARINGVRSAMPMFQALKACPNAVVIRPDMKKYSRVGRQVKEMMRSLTPAVEPISVDEAFLNLKGTDRLHGEPPAIVLARLANTIESEVGISVSIGLSYNKYLAKVASDFEKPRGFAVIGEAGAVDFLKEQPVSLIWGVGKAMKAKLNRDGIHKIGTLQVMEQSELIKRYGTMGMRLFKLSRGMDARRVESSGGAKSVSAETTFNTDKSTAEDLVPILRRLSERVSAGLKSKNIAGRTIVLKLKTTDFKSRTRNRAQSDPTQLADKIFQTGRSLLLKELDGSTFRLLGIGVSDLGPEEGADPADLIDPQGEKRAAAERAMDKVRNKFGDKSMSLGLTFKKEKTARPQREQPVTRQRPNKDK